MANGKKKEPTILMPDLTPEIGEKVVNERRRIKQMKDSRSEVRAPRKVKRIKPRPKPSSKAQAESDSGVHILGTRRHVTDKVEKQKRRIKPRGY